MPLESNHLTDRGTLPENQSKEIDDLPVGHLLYGMAESIAHAQHKLDMEAINVMRVLDETNVEVIPHVTQRVQEDGTLTAESAEPVTRSMLELGFTPTRYQFSEATVEVSFDAKLADEGSDDGAGRRFGLRADTTNSKHHRKYNRNVESNAKVKATLQPVPLPTEMTPGRSTEGIGDERARSESDAADGTEPGGESDSNAATDAGSDGESNESMDSGSADGPTTDDAESADDSPSQ